MASICSGTFILAKAGLMEGKQATTQWSVCQRLAREHPEIKVVLDKIFIRDGNIYSSAGVTAGIDLALRLVEEDFGRNFARVFKQEVGMTPGKYVEKMRIEYAAQQIETRDKGLKRVAQISGFRSEEMMRRAFKRQLNVLFYLYWKRFGREKGENDE